VDFNVTNVTRLSVFDNDPSKLIINETANMSRTHVEVNNDAVAQLKAAKNSGPYLDGCRVRIKKLF